MKRFAALLVLLMHVVSLLQAQSPKLTKVWEYRPAPGQFINTLPKYDDGDNAATMALKAQNDIVNGGMVSLGGYGGYIVFSFDHPIKNVHGKYNLKIEGNSFYAAANPNPNAPKGGSAEPGIVMVSRDDNGNGQPDDAWYELAGSEYYKPQTVHHYRVTYQRPDDLSKAQDVPWTDNQGDNGAVHANSFHSQCYYPLWLDEPTMVFEGTKLANNAIDESGKGNYWVLYCYAWGYADNEVNASEFANFKLDWAVDADGNHVDLDEIHFVKVYTGVNQEAGWLGETSTEVAMAYDWNMLGGYDTVTICGSSYRWNGKNYTESGDYYHPSLRSKSGLDSAAMLHLTLNPVYNTEQTAIACRSYTWHGETYTESGVYTKTLNSVCGCDSIITLNLIIVENYEHTVSAVACDGSYVWHMPTGDTTITESGSFTKRLQAVGGCDSVVTLNLTMGSPSVSHVQATACGGSYTWEGQTYTMPGQYTRTFASAMGCDSTVTLHLSFTDVLLTELTVASCESYPWHDTLIKASGIYYDTLVSQNGCDSVVILNLSIGKPLKAKTITAKADKCGGYYWNGRHYMESGQYTETFTAVNGCDSVVTLKLTITDNVQTTKEVEVCYQDTYMWKGKEYSSGGYIGRAFFSHPSTFDTLQTSNGCDSIVKLAIIWRSMFVNTQNVTSCGSYVWHRHIDDTTITESGFYSKNYITQCGCDSIVELNLTIVDDFSSSFDAEACGSYVWHMPTGDTTITESGQFTKKFASVGGCDSTVTLNLTIKTPVTHEFTASACGAYWWNGIAYAATGDYQQVFRARNGCDSIVTLHLTIDEPTLIDKDITACGSYRHGGVLYMQSGQQTAVYGCDSTVRLNITVNPIHQVAFGQMACGKFEWEGETYTTSGIYPKILTSSKGCDSIVTMDLHVLQPRYNIIYDTVCGSGTMWNGLSCPSSGVYTHAMEGAAHNGCDSIAMLYLEVMPVPVVQLADTVDYGAGYTRHGFNLSASETQKSKVHMLYLQTAQGCDSTVRLSLEVRAATTTATPALLAESVSLHPNPTSGLLQIDGALPFSRVEVYNATGHLVHSRAVGQHRITLNLHHLPAGVYTLRLSGRQATITRRFVKM